MTTPPVTLYAKPGCHLCEAAGQVISAVRVAQSFDLVIVNVLDDPASLQRYRHDVPVVCVNHVEVARHRITADELRAAVMRAGETP